MANKDPDFIKGIVRSNFDKSALLYDSYEERYGLFEDLTNELAKACNIQKGMVVLDIGCGTGASTFSLARVVGEEGRVLGIDFSEKMLNSASEKLGRTSNMEFILCDAENLHEGIDSKVDAILYNACIFLIPGVRKTLQCAYDLLKENGIVGMNYLIGVYGEENAEGVDLFQSAKQDEQKFAPYGRKIMDVNMLSDTLKEIGFKDIKEGRISIKMDREQVMDFYSIPAQSAGLYPKTPYEERLEKLDALLDYLQDKGSENFYQVWGWLTGLK